MAINLFCFPYAGGSRYSYNNFTKSADDNLNLVHLDYPGRGIRFREALIKDLETLADDCFEKIRHQLHLPYAFYGHSMGTAVSYLVTKRIIKEKINPPMHLFLSGRGGPGWDYPEKKRYLLPSNQFRKLLREMGGNSDEILNDEDLMVFFEPILRADFEALEKYRYTPAVPFNIPITVLIGEQEDITLEQANAWQMETQSQIEVKSFPGKHFFIFDYADSIMKIIARKLLPASICV
jgi:surfactin synthase thioesterase subunit